MDLFSTIQVFTDTVTYNWLGIAPDTYLADTVNFFINDVIKIGLLCRQSTLQNSFSVLSGFVGWCRVFFDSLQCRHHKFVIPALSQVN